LSERKLENVSNNVSNATSSGFKKQVAYSAIVGAEPNVQHDGGTIRADLSQGKLLQTGNPLDLAISGEAFFAVRSGDTIFYTRQGHFQLSPEGLVTTPQGYVLQQADGGDLELDRATVAILEDGTIIDQDRPVGRIALYAPSEASRMVPLGGSLFAAPGETMAAGGQSVVRQGMVEASNVVLGDEMVTMMAAIREAESGAKIIQTYDDLIGRAISTLGQAGR
jgi:flagellar basal-body rod protein FlgG